MAFRKTLAQRLFGISRTTNPALTNCCLSSPRNAADHQSPPNKLAPDPGDFGMFRRYFHRHSEAPSLPELRFLPTSEKLVEKLREMNIASERISLDGLRPPAADEGELTVADALKILKVSQLEMVKSRLKDIENDYVSYAEFLEICSKACSSVDQGVEFAKTLDQSGSVIVLGNIVFLRPEKVVKAIQGLISTTNPNNPRTKELQQMEKQKESIDKESEFLVRRELWCGLGYLVVQTAAFMKLTFWDLSWDVMEPICFYVTSIYFMGGYGFFLRTSKEPSFEGFFQSRFKAKQKKLMKAQDFDLERYNELKRACYPQVEAPRENIVSFSSVHGDKIIKKMR